MVAAGYSVKRFNVPERDGIFGPHNGGKKKSDLDYDCTVGLA